MTALIDEARAVEIAKAFIHQRQLSPCDLHRATFGRHAPLGQSEARDEWTVSFIPKDETLRNMEPGQIWVVVDATTGEARLMPLM